MVVTNYARERTALRLGSQVDYLGSPYVAIGSGAATIGVATTGLAHYWDRNLITGSPDMTVAQYVTWTTDFTSTELSGLTMRQFGMFVESSGGKAWQVENMSQIQTYTGAEELQIEITWKVY